MIEKRTHHRNIVLQAALAREVEVSGGPLTIRCDDEGSRPDPANGRKLPYTICSTNVVDPKPWKLNTTGTARVPSYAAGT